MKVHFSKNGMFNMFPFYQNSTIFQLFFTKFTVCKYYQYKSLIGKKTEIVPCTQYIGCTTILYIYGLKNGSFFIKKLI